MSSHPEDPSETPVSSRISRLTSEDSEAVDRLFEGGLAADHGAADDREQGVLDLMAVLEDYPVEAPEDALVHATVARVAREEADREARFALAPVDGDEGRIAPSRIRIPDFFALAAALLFAVGIGLPLVQAMRAQQSASESSHRLGRVGQAIAGFAGDNDGLLPLDDSLLSPTEESGPHCGLEVGWSRHLDLLVPSGLSSKYLFVGDDAAAGRRLVSYRVSHRPTAFRIDQYAPSESLLGDPNPLIEALRRRERPGHPLDGADCHGGRGLMILRFSLETTFLDTAEEGPGDSVWTADGYQPDKGVDQAFGPIDLEDTVLSH